jgi:hypothetical protein
MGSAALAGPNAGGTLILALSEGTVYSAGIDYCGSATAGDCDGAVPQGPVGDFAFPNVINCLAAFPGAGGRLSGVTFGVEYTGAAILDFGPCGDGIEIPDGNWPASGSGTAVTWAAAQTDPLVEVYWFAAYGYGPGYTMEVVAHPTQGGQFADDDVPSNIDDIAGYGVFGFETAGSAPCPPPPGGDEACCFQDGSCQDLDPRDCTAQGGTPQGVGSVCASTNCPPPPATGACCLSDGSCVVTTQADCQGEYQGDGVPCQPDPCIPIPTIDRSWGGVKSIYR